MDTIEVLNLIGIFYISGFFALIVLIAECLLVGFSCIVAGLVLIFLQRRQQNAVRNQNN